MRTSGHQRTPCVLHKPPPAAAASLLHGCCRRHTCFWGNFSHLWCCPCAPHLCNIPFRHCCPLHRHATVQPSTRTAIPSVCVQAGSFASSLMGIVAADSRHIVTGSPSSSPDSRSTRSAQQQGQQGGNQQQQGQRSIEGPARVPADELELKQFDRQLMEREGKREEK